MSQLANHRTNAQGQSTFRLLTSSLREFTVQGVRVALVSAKKSRVSVGGENTVEVLVTLDVMSMGGARFWEYAKRMRVGCGTSLDHTMTVSPSILASAHRHCPSSAASAKPWSLLLCAAVSPLPT